MAVASPRTCKQPIRKPGIKHIAVAGTVGIQDGNYVNANSLMEMAFGRENLNWTDAKAKYDDSVTLLRNRVRATLSQGGKVWVQEAGQSDFTAAWIQALIDVGVHESLIKNNITVVQHSEWNEKHTQSIQLFLLEASTFQTMLNFGGF